MLAAAEVERKDKHVEYSADTKFKEKRKLHSIAADANNLLRPMGPAFLCLARFAARPITGAAPRFA
jgi:hypothetical protein